MNLKDNNLYTKFLYFSNPSLHQRDKGKDKICVQIVAYIRFDQLNPLLQVDKKCIEIIMNRSKGMEMIITDHWIKIKYKFRRKFLLIQDHNIGAFSRFL